MTERALSTRHMIIALGAVAVLTILALVIAVVSQSRAADAQTRAAKVAAQQADDAKHLAAFNDAQAQRLRDAICGTFTDVSHSPVTAATSELGRKLIRDTAAGANVAGCPR